MSNVGTGEKRIFLRKASGLIRTASETDTFIYNLGVVSIGLGVGFLLLSRALAALGVDALAVAVCGYLGAVNLALAVFNLLPGYPLDGGRLLRAWFWQRSGDLRAATRRAAGWGGWRA